MFKRIRIRFKHLLRRLKGPRKVFQERPDRAVAGAVAMARDLAESPPLVPWRKAA